MDVDCVAQKTQPTTETAPGYAGSHPDRQTDRRTRLLSNSLSFSPFLVTQKTEVGRREEEVRRLFERRRRTRMEAAVAAAAG